MTNAFKTTILLAALTGLIIWIGNLIGGTNGMIYALAFSVIMNGISLLFSDKIVLAMYGAKEIKEVDDRELHAMVRNLALSANLPMPKLYSVPSDTPNAFATGRSPKHAVVAVTEGIRRLLTKKELEGVLAHELSHIKNRDILIGSIAAILAGAIVTIARIAQFGLIFGGGGRNNQRRGGGLELLLLIIVTPIAAMLIQMAISRSREYQADATGAKISHNPLGLASALSKLDAYSKKIPMGANPSTAHMFIVNPLSGRSILNAFSTHPPIEKRIEKLKAIQL